MNQRDLELLSSYLDGQLSPSESARLEARFRSDPQLVSVLNDLRATRNLLRKLPARRAPRNFTLTRKMVGQNPPLPRAYPIFRLTTALATLLFVLSFGLNSFGRQVSSQFTVLGRGGGGAPENTTTEAYSTEAPAAEAPAPALAVPAPTLALTQETADAALTAESSALKTGEAPSTLNQSQPLDQQTAPSVPPLLSSTWQVVFAGIAVGGAIFMILLRQLASRRWK